MNIEICSCSGGMAEGFKRAGIRFDLVIDKDPDAVASYERNHGHRPVQMDVFDFLRMLRAGWRPGETVDLFLADPPCTPWSRAGKRRGLADERDCLEATAELIRLLRPRAYLIGNVPGLHDSTSWGVVQEVIGGLAKDGYCVADYECLDAADYGVPQYRVRPFWFGHLDGPCLRWPAPTHGPPTQQLAIGGAGLLPHVTCRQALQHLPLADLGRPVRMKIREKGYDGTRHGGDKARCSEPDRPAKTVVAKDARKGGQILIPTDSHPTPQIVLQGNPKHPVNTPDLPSFTVTAKGDGRGAQGSCVMLVRDPNDTRKANLSVPDQPAFTITRNTHSEGATLLVDPLRGERVGTPYRPSAAVMSGPSRVGGGPDKVLEWPWDRPSTTVFDDDRLNPPGHHRGSNLSGPNAVVLSARAAAILQGFPDGECVGHLNTEATLVEGRPELIEDGVLPGAVCPTCSRVRRWHFMGATKKAIWSQLGQAMPPGLAHAVARSIAEQRRAARAEAPALAAGGRRG